MASGIDVSKNIDESEFADADGNVIGISAAVRNEFEFVVLLDINGECVEFSPERARAVAASIRAHAGKADRKHKSSVKTIAAQAWEGGEE